MVRCPTRITKESHYVTLFFYPLRKLNSVFCNFYDYNRKNLYLPILLIVIFCMAVILGIQGERSDCRKIWVC